MDQKNGRENFLKILKPHMNKNKLILVEDAYTVSKYGHRNQVRDQGSRYFDHPKNVALIIINELRIYDPEIIIMALLHDIIEDTFILSRSGLAKIFGKRVSDGLNLLTKIGTKEEYVAKMAKCQDTGIIIVKFADRLHNLRTIDGVKRNKKEKKLNETKNLYLPLIEKFIKTTKVKKEINVLNYLRTAIKDILKQNNSILVHS